MPHQVKGVIKAELMSTPIEAREAIAEKTRICPTALKLIGADFAPIR